MDMIKASRLFYVALSMFFLVSCIPEIIPQEALLDTPSRHYDNGMKLLEAGKIDASYAEFIRSLELDREYAPGYVGLGLVEGLKGKYQDALKKIEIADLYTRNRQEIIAVHVGFMRVLVMGREKITDKWLEKVEDRFERLILLAPEFPEPYFVMGLAYLISGITEKALEKFIRVVEINEEFTDKAYEHILNIQEMKSNHLNE